MPALYLYAFVYRRKPRGVDFADTGTQHVWTSEAAPQTREHIGYGSVALVACLLARTPCGRDVLLGPQT